MLMLIVVRTETKYSPHLSLFLRIIGKEIGIRNSELCQPQLSWSPKSKGKPNLIKSVIIDIAHLPNYQHISLKEHMITGKCLI